MERKNYKAFIVEGEDREIQIIENLRKVYFKHSNVTIISIPAGQNIYMLWKRMNKNELLSFEQYRNEITPLEIYEKQKRYIERMRVFVLSAFPEFILDYFNYKFWRTTVAYTNWKKECI